MIFEAINILIGEQSYGVFEGKVPQEEKFPYVNHFQVSMSPNFTKDDKNALKVIRYQVSVFSKKKTEALQIAQGIISSLEGWKGYLLGQEIVSIRNMDENDLYEEDAEVHHRVLDFEIKYK